MTDLKSLGVAVSGALFAAAAVLLLAAKPGLAGGKDGDCAVFDDAGYQVAAMCDCRDPWATGGWCFTCCLHGTCY